MYYNSKKVVLFLYMIEGPELVASTHGYRLPVFTTFCTFGSLNKMRYCNFRLCIVVAEFGETRKFKNTQV